MYRAQKAEEYAQKAVKTAIYPDLYRRVYPVLKLCEEVGELGEKIVTHAWGGVLEPDDDRKEALKREAGDNTWYFAAICRDYGLDLGKIVVEAARAGDGNMHAGDAQLQPLTMLHYTAYMHAVAQLAGYLAAFTPPHFVGPRAAMRLIAQVGEFSERVTALTRYGDFSLDSAGRLALSLQVHSIYTRMTGLMGHYDIDPANVHRRSEAIKPKASVHYKNVIDVLVQHFAHITRATGTLAKAMRDDNGAVSEPRKEKVAAALAHADHLLRALAGYFNLWRGSHLAVDSAMAFRAVDGNGAEHQMSEILTLNLALAWRHLSGAMARYFPLEEAMDLNIEVLSDRARRNVIKGDGDRR